MGSAHGQEHRAPIWTKQFRRGGTVSDIVLDGSMLAIGTTSRKLDGQTTGADAFVRSMSVGEGAREWTEFIGMDLRAARKRSYS